MGGHGLVVWFSFGLLSCGWLVVGCARTSLLGECEGTICSSTVTSNGGSPAMGTGGVTAQAGRAFDGGAGRGQAETADAGDAGQAGQGPTCGLPATDCRAAGDECPALPACTGNVLRSFQWSAARLHLNAVAVSADGRVAIGGSYRGTLELGSSEPLPAATDEDGFAAVLDANGSVIWAHAFSGVGAQEVSGATFLRDGSLLVQAANDPMATADTQLPSGAAFVAALDRNGKLQFSEPIRSSQVKPGNVVMTSQGNVVVTGTFGFDLDYSDLHLNWRDGCVYELELGPDGTGISARARTAISCEGAETLALDPRGNSFLEGTQSGITTESGVVSALDSAGETVFERTFPGAPYAYAEGLALDATGSVLVSGAFTGTLDLGAGTWHSGPQIQGAFNYDGWVAKFSGAGGLEWAHQYVNQGSQLGVGAEVALADRSGNFLVAITAGAALIEGEHSAPTTSSSLSVVKLRPSGAKVWFHSLVSSTSEAVATGMASDADGNVWIVGDGGLALGNGSVADGAFGAFLLELAR
jgi:hypothetical protein